LSSNRARLLYVRENTAASGVSPGRLILGRASFDSTLSRRGSIYLPCLRPLAAGFIAPCLPTKTDKSPSGGQWLHEIKHDGFRIIARKEGPRVRLYSRPGDDLTSRFPLIVETLARLRSRSCIIDGEAVSCNDNGVASFDLIRHQRANESKPSVWGSEVSGDARH
jgi:ATP-dependent DNA ligase